MNGLMLMVLIISAILPGLQSCHISLEYPEARQNTYICKCCPSTRLKCTFTNEPILVLWAAPVEGIFDVRSEVGHVVDSSRLAMGEATLTVNASSDMKSSYVCTAFHANGIDETCDFPMNLTMEEDKNFTLTASAEKYGMNIMSDHRYRGCYQNITVTCLDGSTVVESMSNASSMITTTVSLRPYHQYTVNLTANHQGQQMPSQVIIVQTAFPVEEVVAGIACLFLIIIISIFVGVVLLWICIKRKSRISGTQEDKGSERKKLKTVKEEKHDVPEQDKAAKMTFLPQQQHKQDTSSKQREKA